MNPDAEDIDGMAIETVPVDEADVIAGVSRASWALTRGVSSRSRGQDTNDEATRVHVRWQDDPLTLETAPRAVGDAYARGALSARWRGQQTGAPALEDLSMTTLDIGD